MVEAIKELRKICQRQDYNPSLRSRILRFFSIYLTKLLLYTSITANQVDYIRIILSVFAGIFFAFNQYWFNILAVFFMQISFFMDSNDGEIARYRKTQGPNGLFVDTLTHDFLIPLAFIGISIANPSMLPFGFSALLFFLLYHDLKKTKEEMVFVMLNYRLREEGKIEIMNPESKCDEVQKNSFIRKILKRVLPIFNVEPALYLISFAAIFNFLNLVILFYGTALPLIWIIFAYRHIKIGVEPYRHFLK